MFHTIITLAYVIPNIYVFIRILQVFINKNNRLWYILIYILFAAIYPVNNFIPEGTTDIISHILETFSNYLLPFYLYLSLSVLSFDVFLLINKIFRIVPSETIKSNLFRTTGLIIILFISSAMVVAGVINFRTIRITNYDISINAKSSGLRHLKIAFASDFHLKENTDLRFVENFVRKIEVIKPDIMLFGGDIVEGDREDSNMDRFEELLKAIHTKYGVYSVLGNHEFYSGQEKGSFFNRAGIKVLCDNFIVIDRSFNLGGRCDSHFRGRKLLDDLMKTATDSLPVILIDHRPTEIDQVSKSAVDIQLSGHTHNGQLFPINLITRKVFGLSMGYLQKGNTHFFVSSGIRLWGPPVRTTGKSEIMVINVIFVPDKIIISE